MNQTKRIARLIREAEKAMRRWNESLDRLARAITEPTPKPPYPDLTRVDAMDKK